MVTEADLASMSPEEIAEMQKQNCIFCKIIKGEVPSRKIFEDEKIMAVLDIRPATEGHILVMPKEHYPILPLVPRDVMKHMFERTKDLCSSLKSSIPTTGTTVFLANGAIAGQNSPHFLFHIIPRGGGDGLELFHLPKSEVSQEELFEPVKAKFNANVKVFLAQEGILPPEEAQEAAKQQLAKIIDSNPEVKRLIIEDPDGFRQMLAQNPQLGALFQNIDIDALSKKLKEVDASEAMTEQKEEPEKAPVEQSEAGEEKAEEKEEKAEPKEESEEEEQEEPKEEAKRPDLNNISRLFK
ncbi:HIT domain-containing protein [Nanoarchaeota archaeon]